jgi:hypothetical protein
MRSNKHEGRFDIDYESLSMYEGIAEDIGGMVGVNVNWFRWQEYFLEDNFDGIVDNTYDVSSSIPGEGKRWMLPFKMPAIMASITRGGSVVNDRGFYTSDTMRLVINSGDALRLIPELVGNEPNSYIKDRIEYRGQIFTPTRVNPRGAFGTRWAVVTVECNEVNSEELVNDPQFTRYASKVKPPLSRTTTT